MNKPLVTVAIPSFNQGEYLDKALASVFSQEVDTEVMVADGGSDDQTLSVIEKWQPRLKWWRSYADEGQSAAINQAVMKGSAPYVCWLNSDDLFLPNGLTALLRPLVQNSSIPATYGLCWTVNSAGRKIFPYLTVPFHSKLFASFCFIAQPATLIRRNVWEKLNGLDIKLQMAMDYDLWWRIFLRFGKMKLVEKFVAATRMHSDTKTATNRNDHYHESIHLVQKYTGKVPIKWRLFWPLMVSLRSKLSI
jgi:glycosyltransferase involved in cell wall biosynthesis